MISHDEMRKRHYERLNSYRHSAEYAQYANLIGAEAPRGELPSLLGIRWEIDSEIYHEFLDMLPPLGWRGNTFFMSEFCFDDITTKFSKDGNKFYCEFARYPERKKPTVETPWGPAQQSKEIAPGIVRHDTASHGGYYVSPARVALMPKPLREFKPFAGANWYEEDCDWCIVALAFPQYFPDDAIPLALKTLERYRPELFQEVSAREGGRAT